MEKTCKIEIISGNTAYLDVGMALIGLYLIDDRRCILLDCGPASCRERLESALEEAGLVPDGIIASHSHYDHFGNAAYFQQKYNIPVAITFGEAELCRTLPAIKSYLFAYSAGEVMDDPDLTALPCNVDRVIMPSEDDFYLRGIRFGLLRTPGHSPEHAAIITPDRVCYAGDALMCGASLERAKLAYSFNIRQAIESIERFRDLRCDYILCAHKGLVPAPFDSLLDANRDLMEERLQAVADIIDRQMSREEIFTAVRDEMQIRVDTIRKAENLGRFLLPYLECLVDDGTLRLTLRGTGTLCYEPADSQ